MSIPEGLNEYGTFEIFKTNLAGLNQIGGVAIISTNYMNLLNGNSDSNPNNNGNQNPFVDPSTK